MTTCLRGPTAPCPLASGLVPGHTPSTQLLSWKETFQQPTCCPTVHLALCPFRMGSHVNSRDPDSTWHLVLINFLFLIIEVFICMGIIHLLCSEGRPPSFHRQVMPGIWPTDREGMVFRGLQRRSHSQQASYLRTHLPCQEHYCEVCCLLFLD